MSVIDLSVKNPVLVNILMIAIIVFGLVAFLDLPREVISEIKFNWAFIIVVYPGASPQENEDLIIDPIEEEIADLEGIDQILSYGSYSGTFIMVRYETMSDREFAEKLLDLKAEVDKIKNFPEDAEDPVVESFDTTDFMPVLSVILHGDLPEMRIKTLIDDLRDRILDQEGISKVETAGLRQREIWIEVEPSVLEAHGVHVDEVAQAVAMQNRSLPAGSLRFGRSEFLLRTEGKFQSAREIESVVVRSGPSGEPITVADLATVLDTFEEAHTYSRLEGEKAVFLSISKKSGASSLDVIAKTRELVAQYEKESLPPGVRITVANDSGTTIRDTLKVLRNNAFMGLFLVVVLLYLFLGGRNALFVALGIPVTFFATFIFMYFYNESLNSNSIFGLVLVLGVVVDDAIIIIENCYRHYQMGKSPEQAALDGAKEVAWPVLSASMTTVAAFLPLMLMPGTMGKFMRIIPIVVSLVLVASMLESFIILPSHFAEWSRKAYVPEKRSNWIRWLKSRYTPILALFLRRRYWVVAGVFLLTVFAGISVFFIGMDLFADEEINMFSVWVTLPEGTNIDATDSVIRQIETIAGTLPRHEIHTISATTGLLQTDRDWIYQENLGQLMVELVSRDQGRRPVQEIIAEMRSKCQNIPGVKSIEFYRPQGGPPTGKAVEVAVRGKRWEVIEQILQRLKTFASGLEGVVDLHDDFTSPKQELRIRVDPQRAAELGLNTTAVAAFFRTVYEGQIATRWRDAGEEIDILVRYPQRFERSPEELNALKIPVAGPAGIKYVPFDAVATIEQVDGFPETRHIDRDRAAHIYADIDKNLTDTVTPNKKIAAYWDTIKSRYPGYKLDFEGQFKEWTESFSSLTRLFLIGILIIFIILGGQFKSFGQPIIILFTIPFAFIGSVFGLLVSGAPFSIVTMFGMVALAGIAVNDAIVMVTFINSARAAGASRWMSLLRAGRLRLRPIILTTVTTVGGLLPVALGLGGHSEVWAPLANVIVWGMLVGTLMTLFVIPCVYSILIDDLGGWISERKQRRIARRASRDAARFGARRPW